MLWGVFFGVLLFAFLAYFVLVNWRKNRVEGIPLAHSFNPLVGNTLVMNNAIATGMGISFLL